MYIPARTRTWPDVTVKYLYTLSSRHGAASRWWCLRWVLHKWERQHALVNLWWDHQSGWRGRFFFWQPATERQREGEGDSRPVCFTPACICCWMWLHAVCCCFLMPPEWHLKMERQPRWQNSTGSASLRTLLSKPKAKFSNKLRPPTPNPTTSPHTHTQLPSPPPWKMEGNTCNETSGLQGRRSWGPESSCADARAAENSEPNWERHLNFQFSPWIWVKSELSRCVHVLPVSAPPGPLVPLSPETFRPTEEWEWVVCVKPQ